MRRNLDEIIASQAAMLKTERMDAGEYEVPIIRMAFERHLREVGAWLKRQGNMRLIYYDYSDLRKVNCWDPTCSITRWHEAAVLCLIM
jgi:hypothetical protein